MLTLKALSKGKNKPRYIHIYYQQKGIRLIVSTKIEYSKSYCKADCTFKVNKENYLELNARLRHLKNRAEEYLQYSLKNKHQFNLAEAKQYIFGDYMAVPFMLLKNKKIEQVHEQESLPERYFALDYYQEFYDYKDAELNNKLSLKDYKTLWNTLLDFEYDSNKRYTFYDMNKMEWLFKFREYLSQPRVNNTDRNYLSNGYLSDTTINKRFQTLKNWFKWADSKSIHKFDNQVMLYNVKKHYQEIISVTLDEIRELYLFDKYNESERRIIDVFILACMTGLRYGDLKSLDKNLFMYDSDGHLYYSKYNQKTNEKIDVPITSLTKEILEKYDYQPFVPANAVFNRRIKEVLKKHSLLEVPVQKNVKRQGKIKMYTLLKREAITVHTGRKSFITNAKHLGIPDGVIMSATGHKKLSTMDRYNEKRKDYKAFAGFSL